MAVRTTLHGVAIGILACVLPETAIAWHKPHRHFTPGSVCQPRENEYARTVYGDPGVANSSATQSLRVFCPIDRGVAEFDGGGGIAAWGLISKIRSGSIFYVDNNTTTPFWCYMWVKELHPGGGLGGGEAWTPRKYTCPQWGGCDYSHFDTISTGMLGWEWPFAEFDPTNDFWYAVVGYSCSIPPEERANSFRSWISGFFTLIEAGP